MMTIKYFEEIGNKILRSIADDYPNAIDGYNFLKRLIKEDFPYGYANIPEEINLFRILYLKSDEYFKIDNIGVHYFAVEKDKEDILGILSDAEYEGQPYLIRVRTNQKSIDMEQTLRNNLLFQFEYETTLKSYSEIRLVSIEKI